MTGFWQVTTRAVNTNATGTMQPPAGAAASGLCLRVRSMQITGGDTRLDAMISDGATVIWQIDLASEASVSGIDLRGSPGNALTFSFSGTNSNMNTAINVQGDYVRAGAPWGGE
jgi:hypothetical protein